MHSGVSLGAFLSVWGKFMKMELYYNHPASVWEETLPIGNGRMGGMIWGGVTWEKIGLNEESLTSGYERDKNNFHAFENMQKVREMIFAGKNYQAEQTIQRSMLGEYNESYLPLGNLQIVYRNLSSCIEEKNYRRSLSLEKAVTTVDFDIDNVHYHREIFASYPGNAIIVQLTASQPVMEIEIFLDSELKCTFKEKKDGLSFNGQCPQHLDPSYVRNGENAIVWGERGKKFHGNIHMADTDGQWSAITDKLYVNKASTITLVIEVITPATLQGNYSAWKEAHIQDYQQIYQKTELYLGPQKDEPTDVRLQKLKDGKEDNGLFALYFQYGRYLMIASSRMGSLPANLQGIWSWEFQAPWSCNWTTNINLEMNYWPALSCGLKECLEPYFSFVKKLAENGKKTAAIYYHCRGTVVHHNVDGWYSANPAGVAYGEKSGEDGCVCWAMWPMGMAWLVQKFYEYYEYTEDIGFLRDEAYPLFRETALFLVDWLVLYQGRYVTCPSTSPENKFYDEEKRPCAVTMASAMDIELTQEVFQRYLSICHILEINEPLMEEVEERLSKLWPVQIGSYGQILEWFQEYEEVEPGHRHLSHLYGLYPSELWAGEEKMEEAVRISLKHRLENGGGYTGWSCAWIINLMAVLCDGEGVWKYLNMLLTKSTYPNLWDAHEPFQIDGNFGGISGIANMLVQDRGGELKLLPALPKQFSEGYVRGLHIKGNREISFCWKDGKVTEFEK